MIHLPNRRTGLPPRTSRTLPHRQLDQWPPPDLQCRLVSECLRLPDIRPRQSRMAGPRTCALSVPDELARGAPEAYIDQHEFCHLHPLPDGTIHLTLPQPFCGHIMGLGWAEPHPLAGAGLSPRLVMVYSPRDLAEVETLLGFVAISHCFAIGGMVEHARGSPA